MIPSFVKAGTSGGKKYALPLYGGASVIYYRKDLFEEAHVAQPRTLGELVSSAQKVKAANIDKRKNFQGIYLPASDNHFMEAWIFSHGANYAKRNSDGTWKGTLDTPQANAGFAMLQQLWSSLRMSAAVTSVVVVLAVLFGFMAAVAASRFRFKGRGALVMLLIVVQMLPAEALFISQFRMLDDWNLLSTVTGLSLLCLGRSVPFTMWLLRGFIDNIPAELEEAAMVDGCSRVGAFFRVALPLLGPGLITSSVFAFLHTWNEYNLALIVMTKTDHATLPLWLRSFSSETSATDWGGVMAGSALIAVPMIVLFMSVHSR
ncbi:hypothetical protein GCM10015535_64560 [Streptomyces gelaticus]|uniref:ABC transmembrane type-1 domain-containing protein n=1 Tax=Streptomyces gelaticus TaxID=285446 RepID=A0ABQ2W8S6_9ACTN|nr:hypothetical protein GCM10015535_64560 [Streptomyces gelaticus]